MILIGTITYSIKIHTGVTISVCSVTVQYQVTYNISPSLDQYLSLSGGCMAVPVMEQVTDLFCTNVSALLLDGGLLLTLFEMTFR